MRDRHVWIATPTVNAVMASDYVASLAATLADLHGRDVNVTYRTADGPDAPAQRDALAADFLRSEASHLLLVNPDMAFDGSLCARLLARDAPVVGAAYALRSVDLARLRAGLATRAPESALPHALDWSVRLIDGRIALENGFGRVDALAPGYLLVARACLAELAARAPRYRGPFGAPVPALFRDVTAGGVGWTQDFVFCEAWRALGGDVWLYPAAQVRRITEGRYGVPFAQVLASLRRRDERTPGRR
ncbi:MAG: hypothetical protein JO048_08120 [Methylobacteriaceae bacterium]|nr:hypothetical protein [Methylobacteriaceae bacterium]